MDYFSALYVLHTCVFQIKSCLFLDDTLIKTLQAEHMFIIFHVLHFLAPLTEKSTVELMVLLISVTVVYSSSSSFLKHLHTYMIVCTAFSLGREIIEVGVPIHEKIIAEYGYRCRTLTLRKKLHYPQGNHHANHCANHANHRR